jgi:hypothetical protein
VKPGAHGGWEARNLKKILLVFFFFNTLKTYVGNLGGVVGKLGPLVQSLDELL